MILISSGLLQRSIHHGDAEFTEDSFTMISSADFLRALRGSTVSPRPEPVEGRASAVNHTEA